MALLDKFKKKPIPSASKKDAKSSAAKEEKVEAAKPATRGPLAKDGAGEAYKILLHPIFTEKGSRMQAQGFYLFAVTKAANKIQISRAIRDLYGVEPESVNIINMKGKNVRFGRFEGKEKDVKKAMVKLPAGQSLTVLEGV